MTHFYTHWEVEENSHPSLHYTMPIPMLSDLTSKAICPLQMKNKAFLLLISPPFTIWERGERERHWVLKVNWVVYKTLIKTGPCPKMLFIHIMFKSQFYPLAQDWLQIKLNQFWIPWEHIFLKIYGSSI